MQPRQIYASTLDRRDRRWTRRRNRGLVGVALLVACTLTPALVVVFALAQNLT
ncbi:MAG: hypothetical protein QOG15_2301 [Solirubrobacteraceae bacterium]|jgi:hypothetical protein|nr:hypothetical protein [Solirubrobacteraceae bacterium]